MHSTEVWAEPGQACSTAAPCTPPPHTHTHYPPSTPSSSNPGNWHAQQLTLLTGPATPQAPDAYDPTAKGLSFAFDYIDPVHPDCFQIIKRLYGGGDPHDVPNSGPAPVLVRYGELKGVTPVWERITADIEKDAEAVKVLGGWRGWACEGLCCCRRLDLLPRQTWQPGIIPASWQLMPLCYLLLQHRL